MHCGIYTRQPILLREQTASPRYCVRPSREELATKLVYSQPMNIPHAGIQRTNVPPARNECTERRISKTNTQSQHLYTPHCTMLKLPPATMHRPPHHNHHLLLPRGLAPIALPSPRKPIDSNNRHHDRIHSADIIHVAGLDGHGVGEGVHDDGENGPHQQNVVCEHADGTEPEGAVGDVVPAAVQEADYGDGVGDVEEDYAGCDHARVSVSKPRMLKKGLNFGFRIRRQDLRVEGRVRTEIQAPHKPNDDAANNMRI